MPVIYLLSNHICHYQRSPPHAHAIDLRILSIVVQAALQYNNLYVHLITAAAGGDTDVY